jgi:hypothetical protein
MAAEQASFSTQSVESGQPTPEFLIYAKHAGPYFVSRRADAFLPRPGLLTKYSKPHPKWIEKLWL